MRVMVVGAAGFIGRRVFAAIEQAGHEAIGVVRRPAAFARMFPGCRAIACDLARDLDPGIWLPRLEGVDAVVNCAGVLADRNSRAVHVEAPRALYAACEQAGVRRVIHVSAISAVAAAQTAYADEKMAAEQDLKARGLDWVILRPSLVFAEGTHGGTAALRGLAGLPFIAPLPGRGDQPFTPIHADDLAAAVVRLLAPAAPARVILEPCGPETMTLREIVLAWRAWLGLPPPTVIAIPQPLIRRLGWIVDRLGGGPLSSTGVRQLELGNAGDGRAFAAAIGFAPRSMRAWLRARPSSVQDKWHARLYFLRPTLRWVLALSWIASGLIGLAAADRLASAVLRPLGLEALAAPLQFATCGLDVAIGLAVLSRRSPGAVLALQCITVLGYTLALTLADPALWWEPLGPLLKNAAFLGLAAAVCALEDDR